MDSVRAIGRRIKAFFTSGRFTRLVKKQVIIFAIYFFIVFLAATFMWTRWLSLSARRLPLDPIYYSAEEEGTENIYTDTDFFDSTPKPHEAEEEGEVEPDDVVVPEQTDDSLVMPGESDDSKVKVDESDVAIEVVVTPPIDPALEVEAAMADHEIWQFPLQGEIVQAYGMIKCSTMDHWLWHQGLDISAPLGTKVLAARTGTVQKVEQSSEWGWVVTLVHPQGWQTVYASCDQVLVREGDFVEVGVPIATVGQTALREFAAGPHLHFEIWHQGQHRNPAQVLNLKY